MKNLLDTMKALGLLAWVFGTAIIILTSTEENIWWHMPLGLLSFAVLHIYNQKCIREEDEQRDKENESYSE